MSISSGGISMHGLEYHPCFLEAVGGYRAAFSIILVGNQIADSVSVDDLRSVGKKALISSGSVFRRFLCLSPVRRVTVLHVWRIG
jgi:hypothetical protein